MNRVPQITFPSTRYPRPRPRRRAIVVGFAIGAASGFVAGVPFCLFFGFGFWLAVPSFIGALAMAFMVGAHS